MMTIADLTEFLGWATVINLGFLMVTFFVVVYLRNTILQIHKKLFGLMEEDILRAYFQYMAQFKIVVVVFFLAPYVALKLMG